MPKTFFISDTHFGHSAILRFDGRPFRDIGHMHDEMISSWNAKVSEEDTVYHLGDVGLCKTSITVDVLSQLNGIKHLIIGNHDKRAMKAKSFVDQFESCNNYLEITLCDSSGSPDRLVLFHYPLIEWNGFFYNSIHLYGHVHNTMSDIPNRSFNVSASRIGYSPIEATELIELIKLKPSNVISGQKALLTIELNKDV